MQTADKPPEWDREFLKELDGGQREEDFWSNLEEAWSTLKTDTSSPHPWLKEYEQNQEYK